MSVPIIIGVTGHRDLREQDIPALKNLIRSELQKIRENCPNSPLKMLNSLAAGGDTLAAEIALELEIPLICPLPMEAGDYRQDFEGEDLLKFDQLWAKAEDVFVSPAKEPIPENPNRDFCYRQAGIYVAEHSHLLIALWDGSAPKREGCGTAETVNFMLHRFVDGGAIFHIATPRKKNGNDFPITGRLIEHEEGSLAKLLRQMEQFNADCERD